MPAVSQKQHKLFAVALHNPSKLKKRNRGLLKLGVKKLKDFLRVKRSKLPITKNAVKQYKKRLMGKK